MKTKPAFLNKSITKITRLDLINAKETIIKIKGHRRTSQLIFTFLKISLTQAYQEGKVDSNPGSEISNIHYKEKKRQATAANILAKLIKDRNAFRSIEAWAFFTVLATAGMRRGEALGITPSRINNDILTIDRQWNLKTFIEPKGGFTRIIPLSKLTLYALSCLEKPKTPDTQYFKKHCNWISACFGQARMYACAKFPEDVDILHNMTPHVLRHSLNTALLVSGLSPMLVAEYLSWEHQDLLKMQSRYTHLVSDNIIPVANTRFESLLLNQLSLKLSKSNAKFLSIFSSSVISFMFCKNSSKVSQDLAVSNIQGNAAKSFLNSSSFLTTSLLSINGYKALEGT